MIPTGPISADDPRLTTLALGEEDCLDEADRRELSEALAQDDALQEAQDSLRAFSAFLRTELSAEPLPLLTEAQLASIHREGRRTSPTGSRVSRLLRRLVAPFTALSPRWRLATGIAAMATVWVFGIPLVGWGVDRLVRQPIAGVYFWLDQARSSSGHASAARVDMCSVAPVACHVTPLKDRIRGQLGLGSNDDSSRAPSLSAAPSAAPQVNPLTDVPQAEQVAPDPNAAAAANSVQASPQVAIPTGIAPPGRRDTGRKVIKDAALGLEVAHLDSTLSQVEGIAAQAGGDVLESKRIEHQGPRKAFVRLAVPADQFELVLGRLRDLATAVLSDQSSSADVSQEYVDLQSQLANLEATQARIKAFLAQAKSVEEALVVNARLQEIEGQMNTIKGRLSYLAEKSSYSTIAIDLSEQAGTPTITPTPSATPTATATPSPTPLAAYDPAKPAREAYGVLRGLLRSLATLTIWLAVMGLPMIAMIATAWWLGRWGLRRLRGLGDTH